MIKSILKITKNYTKSRYHKIKVSRLPGEEVVFMMPTQATLSDLYQHIAHHFPDSSSNLIAGPSFAANLDAITITE